MNTMSIVKCCYNCSLSKYENKTLWCNKLGKYVLTFLTCCNFEKEGEVVK